MLGRGFTEVYSLAGGLRAWDGAKAAGPPQQGLFLLSGQETTAGLLAVAYGLERQLGKFYGQLAAQLADPGARELFQQLGRVEEKHMAQVRAMFEQAGPSPEEQQALEGQSQGSLEGGFTPGELLKAYPPASLDREQAISLAMMIETQAMDLYLRMAQSRQGRAKEALMELAEQEKDHLARLGRLMDQEPAPPAEVL